MITIQIYAPRIEALTYTQKNKIINTVHVHTHTRYYHQNDYESNEIKILRKALPPKH